MRFNAHNSVDRIRICPSHSSCETQYLDNLCILPVQTSVSLHSRSYIRWASCLICSSFLILDACFAAFAIAGSSTGSLSLVPFLLVFRKLPDTPETKNRPARWSANLWLFGYRTPIGCSSTGRPSILDYYQDQSELLWWSHYEVSQFCLAHSHWSTTTLMIPVRSMLSMQHQGTQWRQWTSSCSTPFWSDVIGMDNVVITYNCMKKLTHRMTRLYRLEYSLRAPCSVLCVISWEQIAASTVESVQQYVLVRRWRHRIYSI